MSMSCYVHVYDCSDGKVLVGYEAVAQQESNPKNTVYDAKRFIGKKFTAEQMSHEAKRYSFQVWYALIHLKLWSNLV